MRKLKVLLNMRNTFDESLKQDIVKLLDEYNKVCNRIDYTIDKRHPGFSDEFAAENNQRKARQKPDEC